MFQRLISKQLQFAAESFPVTLLMGPRQSGKTTLLKELFPTYAYANLESPDVLMHAKHDPRGFLVGHQKNMIIDEAQNFPELFSYLQEIVDTMQVKRHFILSGSQNFLLAEHISQTLARRPQLYFWRDHLGVEINGLREKGERLQAIEIKASTTVLDDFFQGLERWQQIAKEAVTQAYLIYAGDATVQRKNVTILPWNGIMQLPL